MTQPTTQKHQWARALMALPNFYVLDTETTGVGKQDEIIQIGIVDKAGHTVMNTLIKPTVPIHPDASAVNGITQDRVADAPTFADVYVELCKILAATPLVAYNMPFDWRMMQQTARAYKLPTPRTGQRHCAMREYAAYRGTRWQKLTNAAAHEQIEVADAHTALGDVMMTLALIQKMAAQG